MQHTNNKILFVGDLNPATRSYLRFKNLKQLGNIVTGLSYVTVPHVEGVDKLNLIDRIFWKLKIPYDRTQINKRITESVQKINFDLIWIDKGVMIYPWVLKRIKKKYPSIRIISCSEDDMYARHNRTFWYLNGLKHYDLVFTTKTYNLSELKLFGAKRTELFLDSYDQDMHKPPNLSEKDIKNYSSNVCFIGTFEQDRAEKILFLAENGIEVVVYGNGWKKWTNKSPNLIIKNRPVYSEEYAKVIAAANINLCFLRKINRDQVTSRSVEIPACGGFMLGERTQRHLDFFNEGKEAEFFDSSDELLRKVRYYLDNNNERVEIIKAGHTRCLGSGYSMQSQIKLMLGKI